MTQSRVAKPGQELNKFINLNKLTAINLEANKVNFPTKNMHSSASAEYAVTQIPVRIRCTESQHKKIMEMIERASTGDMAGKIIPKQPCQLVYIQ